MFKDLYKTIASKSEGTYSELRSKFLAFAHPVSTVEEAMALVEQYQKRRSTTMLVTSAGLT